MENFIMSICQDPQYKKVSKDYINALENLRSTFSTEQLEMFIKLEEEKDRMKEYVKGNVIKIISLV